MTDDFCGWWCKHDGCSRGLPDCAYCVMCDDCEYPLATCTCDAHPGSGHVCTCPVGTRPQEYANTTILPIPAHMSAYRRARTHAGLSGNLCLDRCIVVEIQQLWKRGVVTYGSCCGHHFHPGMFNVNQDDVERMKAWGYTVQPNRSRPGDEDSFYPMGVEHAPQPAKGRRMTAAVEVCSALINLMARCYLCDSTGPEFVVSQAPDWQQSTCRDCLADAIHEAEGTV